eukprot:NODE_32_length_32166_cov_0.707737.p11 type:complete len:192 gc:universal NODE_32_length_32166_cov_0.707737:31582-32157(+)
MTTGRINQIATDTRRASTPTCFLRPTASLRCRCFCCQCPSTGQRRQTLSAAPPSAALPVSARASLASQQEPRAPCSSAGPRPFLHPRATPRSPSAMPRCGPAPTERGRPPSYTRCPPSLPQRPIIPRTPSRRPSPHSRPPKPLSHPRPAPASSRSLSPHRTAHALDMLGACARDTFTVHTRDTRDTMYCAH